MKRTEECCLSMVPAWNSCDNETPAGYRITKTIWWSDKNGMEPAMNKEDGSILYRG